MAAFLSTMIERAKADKKTIVLPEGNDERVLEAARKIVDQEIADVIVIGNPDEIAQKGFALEGVHVIDNVNDPLRKELAEGLFELRKAKGMTAEEADKLMDDVMYFLSLIHI